MDRPGTAGADHAAKADRVILIGPMGAGKSSIARELARRTGRRWVDTDRMVADRTGLTISDIFAARGEVFFRMLEAEALRELVNRPEAIVATGGGIVLEAESRQLLRALGTVVWLSASEDILFERVSRNNRRPLLQGADPRGALQALLAKRDPLYAECADPKIDTSATPHAHVAGTILQQVAALTRAPEAAGR